MKRILELAKAVREAPDDAELRAVFADALLEQKDPAWNAMGELVVATPERARALARTTRAIGRLPSKHVVRFGFDHGLIRRATPGKRAFKVPAVEELFQRPELAVLSEVDLRWAWPSGARARVELVRALGRIVPKDVRWLGLGPGVDLGAILAEYPSLMGLGLLVDEAAPVIDLLARTERITDLELAADDFDGGLLRRLADLPLRRLVIYAEAFTPGAHSLDPFLASKTLESLGFMTENHKRAIAFLEALFASTRFARMRSFGVALDRAEEVREWLTENRERWADKAIFTGPSTPTEDPEWDDALDELGSLLSDVDRDEEALPIREDLVVVDPRSAWFWDNLGDSRKAVGDLEPALAAYEQAIKLEKELASAWRGKADTLDDLERPEEALAAWERAVQLEPKDGYSHNGLGAALEKLGRNEEALAAYSMAWRRDKTLFHAPSNRGDLNLALGRIDDAYADYERCLKPGPNKADYAADDELVYDALVGKAFIAKLRGDFGSARDYVRRAQKLEAGLDLVGGLDPVLAEMVLAEGKLTAALAIAERICARDDVEDDDHDLRAAILLELDRVDEAEAAFAVMAEPLTEIERAFFLERRGQEPAALALLGEPDPADDVFCAYHALIRVFARGVFLARAGRGAEATACFREVHAGPHDPEALKDSLARAAGSPHGETCMGEWCFGAAPAVAIAASILDGAPDEARARAKALGAALETRDPSERSSYAFDFRRLLRLASIDKDALLARTLAVVEGNALPRTLQ